MNVCEEINREKPAAVVITRDGCREFKILSALGRRYNGKKTLWFPKTPIKTIRREKKIGLSPLNVLTSYPGEFKLYSFLFLVDREHVVEGPKEEIERYS